MPYRNIDELYADWHLVKYSSRGSEVWTFPGYLEQQYCCHSDVPVVHYQVLNYW